MSTTRWRQMWELQMRTFALATISLVSSFKLPKGLSSIRVTISSSRSSPQNNNAVDAPMLLPQRPIFDASLLARR